MSILPGYPIPPPPPSLPSTTGATEFNPINSTHHNPNSKHTNSAFIISIVVSAIGVIFIGLVCFAIGYWLRKKLMAPPPSPKRSSTVHQWYQVWSLITRSWIILAAHTYREAAHMHREASEVADGL
ncbi:hypothetical protein CFP56_022884 [Quercus suber]|uniref:Uncharacterized protein n=1 Tax=Quercus suber TaxID=58331 RepID=A0AAW0KAL0_QUESU